MLLSVLTEPCVSVVVVAVAVLTGMRNGEILALRWKRIDLLGATLEVAKNYSSGEFGSPKTRSSRRVIPVSSALRSVLETHGARMNFLPSYITILHGVRHRSVPKLVPRSQKCNELEL
jgi:integrase